MIDLEEEPTAGERNTQGSVTLNLNNVTILSVKAFSGKSYGLQITGTGLKEGNQLTISITAYYLLKLLKSFNDEQLALIEDCVKNIEKGSFEEGDIYEFPVPLRLKPEIYIKVGKDSDAKTTSNIKSLSNSFYAKGISKKYVKVDRQQSDPLGETAGQRIPSLLVKSFQLYEEYKKEGFGEFFARKNCGLENDILFELAKLYAKQGVNRNGEDQVS
ncbi:MAG TPA: hypothetical protein VF622_06335 [Segetibacter sp.]|jgi:hypothetical protein